MTASTSSISLHRHLLTSSPLDLAFSVIINEHRRSKGVEEIDFDACFAAGVSWWKDGKPTTKHAEAKAHPEIEEWNRRATWFPNARGTSAMTILTSTRAHTAKTCVRD